MSKIKVGQIYKYTDNYLQTENIIAVTRRFRETVCCVGNDGCTWEFHMSNFKDYKLIAEYDTWQEAVNSKEFNNETT